jgi:hypothetical protein
MPSERRGSGASALGSSKPYPGVWVAGEHINLLWGRARETRLDPQREDFLVMTFLQKKTGITLIWVR